MCRRSDGGRAGGRRRRRHVVRADQSLYVVEHLGCRARAAGGVKATKPAPPSPGGNLPSVALTVKAMEPESGRRPDRWRRCEGPRPPLAPGQVTTYVMTYFVLYKLIIYYCILKICVCRTCTLLVACNKPYWISVFHLGSNVVETIPYPKELHRMPYAWFCSRKPFLSSLEGRLHE